MYKIIIRNFGWFKRKHGILLDPLPPTQKKILLENKFVRDIAHDEQTIQVVFKIADMEHRNQYLRKWWHNPYRDEISTFKEIVNDASYVEWKCAICENEIWSSMKIFDVENFCCEICQEVHSNDNSKIDGRIVDSSVRFTKYCKKLLKREQKDLILYIKRNKKK